MKILNQMSCESCEYVLMRLQLLAAGLLFPTYPLDGTDVLWYKRKQLTVNHSAAFKYPATQRHSSTNKMRACPVHVTSIWAQRERSGRVTSKWFWLTFWCFSMHPAWTFRSSFNISCLFALWIYLCSAQRMLFSDVSTEETQFSSSCFSCVYYHLCRCICLCLRGNVLLL